MNEQVTKTIEGTEVTLFTVAGRWTFAGSRFAGRYLTAEDAAEEAREQLLNHYMGPLNTAKVDPKTHRVAARGLAKLAGKF